MKDKYAVNAVMLAGVACILLATLGPLWNIAGILWLAALLFFAAAPVMVFRRHQSDGGPDHGPRP
ncbi:hypothetical protein N2K95_01225 [Arthrobacter zhaoxinii]|uniref:Uncharacterized protein n=1 Tax=Arthrobacter zhaoxinii TaxID=2964616 RepID=A0ABY5YST3_9MICC|nr:hypothetical protein [Arthrobacter zhaoxinii]UWX97349.1 hypothetical protein N2K95_01225 [Arthrobacter zhaoxinii]